MVVIKSRSRSRRLYGGGTSVSSGASGPFAYDVASNDGLFSSPLFFRFLVAQKADQGCTVGDEILFGRVIVHPIMAWEFV